MFVFSSTAPVPVNFDCMERSKYFVLHGTKVWIDKRVSK